MRSIWKYCSIHFVTNILGVRQLLVRFFRFFFLTSNICSRRHQKIIILNQQLLADMQLILNSLNLNTQYNLHNITCSYFNRLLRSQMEKVTII